MGTHPIFESDFDCLTESKIAGPKSVQFLVSPSNEDRIRLKMRTEKRPLQIPSRVTLQYNERSDRWEQ